MEAAILKKTRQPGLTRGLLYTYDTRSKCVLKALQYKPFPRGATYLAERPRVALSGQWYRR